MKTKLLRKLVIWICRRFLGEAYIIITCTRETVNGEPVRLTADTNIANSADIKLVALCVISRYFLKDKQEAAVKEVNKILNQ